MLIIVIAINWPKIVVVGMATADKTWHRLSIGLMGGVPRSPFVKNMALRRRGLGVFARGDIF